MITAELARRTRELADARQPFVTATVVRAQKPTSVEAGSVAIVLADGTIEGFVGGSCTEQSVKAQSLRALETGEAVLLRVLPEGGTAPAEDGAVSVENPCLSGGAIEIFLEPARPAPRVLVVGDSPIAGAMQRVGAEVGMEMVHTDGHDPAPDAGDLALVVATHGRDELHALRVALESGVPYVGLVASGRRGASVLDELRRDGVGEGLLERIDVPAGIPIGSHTPGEIALSILARIVAVRRGQRGQSPPGAPEGQRGLSPASPSAEPAALAVDPICGMTVAAVASTPSVERDGETVYFCCEGCKAKFEAGEHASVGG
jgi:xanthine dehydrogenase accessory factor